MQTFLVILLIVLCLALILAIGGILLGRDRAPIILADEEPVEGNDPRKPRLYREIEPRGA